jgi:SOS-response transcriptional repressor LexA
MEKKKPTPAAIARGQRLKFAREKRELSQEQLAIRLGYSGSGRISNYEGGEREGSLEDWDKMAHELGVTFDWLVRGAEHVEMPLAEYNVARGPNLERRAPLISWVQAGSFAEVVNPYAMGDAEDWLPVPGRAGPRTFALRVRGISMEKEYFDGDIIFVDPDEEPRHGSHVVVRLEQEKEATFKQLIVEGERRVLKALNPSWPEPFIGVTSDATICGVVIGKYVDKRNRK